MHSGRRDLAPRHRLGDRGRPHTRVCAVRPEAQSSGHRSAVQVVLWEALTEAVS